MLTETVFAWPGVGSWLEQAIFDRDYPVLQGGILFLAVVFVVVNLLVDISYAILNPRIRLSADVSGSPRSQVAEIELDPRRRGGLLARRAGRALRRNPGAIVGAVLVCLFVARARSSRRCSRRTSPTSVDLTRSRHAAAARPVGAALARRSTSSAATSSSRIIYGARYSLVIGVVARRRRRPRSGSCSAPWPATSAAGSTP